MDGTYQGNAGAIAECQSQAPMDGFTATSNEIRGSVGGQTY